MFYVFYFLFIDLVESVYVEFLKLIFFKNLLILIVLSLMGSCFYEMDKYFFWNVVRELMRFCEVI